MTKKSQSNLEIQKVDASHKSCEDHESSASHSRPETHNETANTLTYTELRKKMRDKKTRSKVKCVCGLIAVDIHHKNADHSNNETENLEPVCKPWHNEIHGITPQIDELGALVRTYWGIQRFKLGLDNQTRAYKAIGYPIENFKIISDDIGNNLKGISKIIRKEIKDHEMYEEAMKVGGFGPLLFAGLVSIIKDPARFENPSKLWKFFGLHTENGAAVKRKRGTKLEFSLKNRTFSWKIADSFNKVRNRKKSGAMLVRFHDFYRERDGEKISKGHVFNRAKRKTVKIFLACFWAKWLEIKGIKPKSLYVEKLGHKHIYKWEDFCDE